MTPSPRLEIKPDWADWLDTRQVSVKCKTCGCTFTQPYDCYDGRTDKPRMIGGIPTGPCPVCQRETERKAANETRRQAVAQLRATGLPVVHEFTDSGQAYDSSQCSDDIEMGDVLVIKEERVVGFLLSAWPVAVTKAHGKFHAFTDPHHPAIKPNAQDSRDWTASHDAAVKVARELGYPLATDR